MSWLRNVGGVGALAVLVASLGCGSSTASTTAPTYDNFTDVFSDGVLLQGATVASPDFGPAGSLHKFTIHQASSSFPASMVVTIGFMSPVSTIIVGVGLTTFNKTTQTCDLPLPYSTFSATLGNPISVSTGTTGDYCVALFDVGNVVTATNYTVSVAHN